MFCDFYVLKKFFLTQRSSLFYILEFCFFQLNEIHLEVNFVWSI